MAAQSCQPATLNKTSPGYAARVWAQPSTQRPDERSRPWPWWRPDRRSKGAREHQTQAKSSNEESFEILPVDQHLSLLPYSNPLSCTNGEQDVERAEEVLTGGRHQSEEARLHQGTAGREILHCVQEFKASTDRKLQ